MDHSTLQDLSFTTAAFYEATICYKRLSQQAFELC